MISDTRSLLDRLKDGWLFEMPQRTGSGSKTTYDTLILSIDENIKLGLVPKNINGLFYLEIAPKTGFYWLGDRDIVTQVIPFEHGIAVSLTGKKDNSQYYASELYERILQSTTQNLLFSGELLSTEGEGIWRWLINNDRLLLVYDPDNPGIYQHINSEEKFNEFISDHPQYRRYRYVLSTNRSNIIEGWNDFNLVKIYKLAFNLK